MPIRAKADSRKRCALASATRAVIESLEDRRLLSAATGAGSAAEGTSYTLQLDKTGLGTPTATTIDWGDGYTSSPSATANSATHTYFTPGRYVPSATVTDSAGVHPLSFGLDPAFGTGGVKVDTSSLLQHGEAHSALIQHTGSSGDKLLVAGWASPMPNQQPQFVVVRYNLDGSLDTTFGQSGAAYAQFTSTWGEGAAMAIDSQGRIVVVGGNQFHPEIDVARFTANGVLDTTFGTNGTVSTTIQGGGGATSVVFASDDSLYVGGFTYNGIGNCFYTVARFTSGGVLDTSWGDPASGQAGYVSTHFQGTWEWSTAMVADAQGRLLVGGWELWPKPGWNFGLIRYNADGTLDESFGGGTGMVATDFDFSDDGANAVAVQPDGKILAVGQSRYWTTTGNHYRFAAARYNDDGSPDASFGGLNDSQGLVTLNVGSGDSAANAVVLQADGRIVLAGSAYDGSRQVMALARLNIDGSVDLSFGKDGAILTGFSGDATAFTATTTPDGGILAAGSANPDANFFNAPYFALAKYLPDIAVTVTQPGLAAPSGLVAAISNENSQNVALSWQAPPGAPADIAYYVYRSTQSDFDPAFTTLISASAEGTSYEDSTANTGTTYYYRVVAVNHGAYERSVPSNTASYRTDGTPRDQLRDGGFESPRAPANSWIVPEQGVAPWTTNGAPFMKNQTWNGNPDAPEGTQALYVETSGSVSQDVDFLGGMYAMTFFAAQRNDGHSQQDIQILIDGTRVAPTITPTSTSYSRYTTAAFWVWPGNHTVTIGGANTAGGDNVGYIDDVHLLAAHAPALVPTPINVPLHDTGGEVVATFSGQGPDWAASNFQSVIHWSDGVTETAQVSGPAADGSTFSISTTRSFDTLGMVTGTLVVTHVPTGLVGTASVAVTAVTPLPTLANQTAHAGQLVTLSGPFYYFNPALTYIASVNWGDGSSDSAAVAASNGVGSILASHTYATTGTYHPVVTLTPSSGSASVLTCTVTVQNSAPVLDPLSNLSIGEGHTALLTGKFTDADPDDTHTSMVDWGDGSLPQPASVTESSGAGQILAPHIYAHGGTFTVTVTLTDASGAQAQDTATVTVANVAPDVDIGESSRVVVTGTAVNFVGRVSDPGDGDTFSYAWEIRNAANQSVLTATTPDLAFTPASNGTYTATLTVTDADGATGTATCTVAAVSTIDPPPTITDPPTAPDNLTVTIDSALNAQLAWRDNAANEEGFEVEWSDDGTNFYVIDTVGPNVTTYTDPSPVYNIKNYYRVRAYAQDLDSAPTTVQQGKPVTSPTPFDDENGGLNASGNLAPYSINHNDDSLIVFAADGLIKNDMDFAGRTMTIVGYTQPAHGTLTVYSDGGFLYQPSHDFVGVDSFTYTTSDSSGHVSEETSAAIDVTNEAPIAPSTELNFDLGQADWQGTTVDGAMTGSLQIAYDPDYRQGASDTLTYTVLTNPKHGTLSYDANTGQFLYTANASYEGIDSFAYKVNDGFVDSLPGVITIRSHKQIVAHSYAEVLRYGDSVFLTPSVDPFTLNPSFTQGTVDADPQDPPFYSITYTAPNFSTDDSALAASQYGAVAGKPGQLLMHVIGPNDPKPDDPGDPCVFMFPGGPGPTHVDPGLDPEVKVTLHHAPEHGTVVVNANNTFDYQVGIDPATGKPYVGWDFFSVDIQQPWGGSIEQYFQMDIDPVAEPPTTAGPESQWKPEEFSRDLKGLWQYYIAAKNELINVLQKMQAGSAAVQALAAAPGDDNEAEQIAAINALDAVEEAFKRYDASARVATSRAGDYMKTVWYTSQADFDVLSAIQSLPREVAGVTPTKQQMQKWATALASYDAGADFMVANNTFVVTMAKETHDAMQEAIQAAGFTAIAATGAELLAKEGCAAFAKYAAQTIVSLGVGVGVSYASQNAMALARKFGLSEDGVRIFADSVQVLSLLRAARAQRKAAGANCFAAGTTVATANGPENIEDIHVGQRVLTQVFASGPGAPPAVVGDANATSVDPETWRQVTLDMPDATGDYQMKLLEPLTWLANEGASAGGWVDLALPELGISGAAQVESIDACPTIDGGPGRVVLGTFNHVSHDLVDVNLVGGDSPLRVTAGHKLWSLDRGDWVEAGELRSGERLATEQGAATVASVVAEAGAAQVFNLDVELDHRYFVGDAGVLAHNADPCDRTMARILDDDNLFRRWLYRAHPNNRPLSNADALSVWQKLLSLGLSPHHDGPHAGTQWDMPHINVDGVHIPVLPGFTPP